MKKIGKVIDIIALWEMAGFAFLLLFIFYKAYFHSSKKITLDVNAVGEAHWEAVLFGVLGIIFLIAVCRYFWRQKNGRRKVGGPLA